MCQRNVKWEMCQSSEYSWWLRDWFWNTYLPFGWCNEACKETYKKKSLISFREKFKTMSNFPLRSVYYMKDVSIISEKLFSFPTSWMFSSTWGNKTANTTWLLCISFFFSSVSIFYIQVKCSSRLGVVIHIRAIYSTVSRYRVFYLQKKKQLLMPCVSPQIYPLTTRSACQIVFRYHYVDWVIESEIEKGDYHLLLKMLKFSYCWRVVYAPNTLRTLLDRR